MTPDEVLSVLQAWRAAGWIRALDLALARFLNELDAQAPGSLLLAAALLAHLEGRGHSCLPLRVFLRDPQATLAWPPAATAELAAALQALPVDGPAARAAWAGRAVMQIDPADGQGTSPLVLCGDRLYLRRYWHHELRVATDVLARALARDVPDGGGNNLDRTRVRALMDLLFLPAAAAKDPSAATAGPDWQKVACAVALRGRLTLLTGGPGTGKTYTAARLLVLLQALHTGVQPLRVALAAPTGKAAARLRQSIGTALQGLHDRLGDTLPLADWAPSLGPAQTLHALLGPRPGTRRFRHDAANPLDVDLLFVDEASMVHLEMMATLLDALPAGARVVLLGDRDQLASVEAGAVMGDLCQGAGGAAAASPYSAATADWVRQLTGETIPVTDAAPAGALSQQTVVLRQSRRFGGPIGNLALSVNRGDGAAALATLRAEPEGEVVLIETADAGAVARLALEGRPGARGGYRTYLDVLGQQPDAAEDFGAWASAVLRHFDDFRVLCAVREGPWGVSGLNAGIERALSEHGLLQRRGEWYPGRPVMVTRNDPALGVFNGDIGVVLQPPGTGPLRAYFLNGATLHSVSVGRLADVETAFALTVHKSQGSEFGHVVLVLPPEDSAVVTRELAYTGITRAKSAFTLVARQAQGLARASGRLTSRLSGLQDMLRTP